MNVLSSIPYTVIGLHTLRCGSVIDGQRPSVSSTIGTETLLGMCQHHMQTRDLGSKKLRRQYSLCITCWSGCECARPAMHARQQDGVGHQHR